jgi:glutamate-ammonia-ligase adenylyltransferase
MPLPANSQDWEQLLAQTPLKDVCKGADHLADLAGNGANAKYFEPVLAALLRLLPESANPDQAIVQFSRFVQGVPDRTKLFKFLQHTPRAIEILLRLFVASQFLAEILIANPDYVTRLTQHQQLAELKSRQQFFNEALTALGTLQDEAAQLDALRRFQRWELLRIGACDAFGIVDLRAVTIQLSLLADSLVQACLHLATQRTNCPRDGLVILALGKLGGEELNYSSDIDLVFLSDTDPQAYWQVCQRLIQSLNRSTAGGFLYRVDMRLRPWGKAGPLVSSLEAYFEYLQQHAELWELQSLLKARVIAGDFDTGQRFLNALPQYQFHTPAEALRTNIRETKEKIESGAHGRVAEWGNVKSGVGSIRDVEFTVQFLQLLHGDSRPEIRTFNTLEALVRLTEADLLQADEYRILTDGYVFLRKVEHALQLLHYKQSHQLPVDPQELEYLARRLDFPTVDSFLKHYEQHRSHVREVYERHLDPGLAEAAKAEPQVTPVERHIARMEPTYREAFTPLELIRHAELAQLIRDDNLIELEAIRLSGDEWKITIIAYDYHGELSLICGLLLEYGFTILSGQVYTYHGTENAKTESTKQEKRPKIVDVFHVKWAETDPDHRPLDPATWGRYREDIHGYLRRLHRGEWQLTQGDLAKRVAAAIEHSEASRSPLYPVEMQFDNSISERYTVFTIRAKDTPGFLYELAHALALNSVSIGCVELRTIDGIARDTLYVTDQEGRKITDANTLQQLRTTTVLIKHFTHLLPHSPNPASALLHFREFLAQLAAQPDWPSELATLEQTQVLDALARLLGVSDFLWNDFLRMQHASLFPIVRDVATHSQRISQAEMREQLSQALSVCSQHFQRVSVLEAFRDREMFRVDMRHILGHIPEFGDFSSELTDVAEVVVAGALEICLEDLRARHGNPILATPDSPQPGQQCPISLCALGKCGGRELGFASDIELLLIYEGAGQTNGGSPISNKEFCFKLVERLSQILRTRREGIFEVDWRLRPYGRAGDLAVSLESFTTYFAPEGQAWPFERQALVKLRPIAGDQVLGQQIVAARDDLLYRGLAFDPQAMRGMRERQVQQLVTSATVNAKFSPGGLVDVEYMIQGLQITYGRDIPELKTTNTWEALAAMQRAHVLPNEETRALQDAYRFWRLLIDALRMVRGDARDLTVPQADTEDFRFLSRRLGYPQPKALQAEILQHLEAVQLVTAAARQHHATSVQGH